METGPDKNQPPKGGWRSKLVRPKQRTLVPLPPSSKTRQATTEKKPVKRYTSGRKPTYAELFAPEASSSSSQLSRKMDMKLFDPVNINEFVKKMEEKEKMAKEQFNISDSIKDFPPIATSNQPASAPGRPGPSTSRGGIAKKKTKKLETNKAAREGRVQENDTSLEGAVSNINTSPEKRRGDVAAASITDSIKDLNLAPKTGRKQKEKLVPTPPASGSGPSTSKDREAIMSDLRKLEAKKKVIEEIIQDYDCFIENATAHVDVFRERGDVFTTLVLDSLKANEFAPVSPSQVKKKE